ncbi:hypothetical protein PV08_11803 [Exophiala spinifera]|uniref:Uncharacterized protein n=1 Tax=Exophiala spinifera TaxID=91928 RepID=A0A0D1ZAL5_9EURO|nr:uncharacterized protein PV08_11803 [Exophiala spinifera]KIW10027.1 hypothetical protein PV08_11803 [Exophiala spinifera]
MPDTERRRPRVATCEDWDEEAQAILPGSRTSANVAIKRSQQELTAQLQEQKPSHDGFDSGYVSRAGTLVSDSSTRSRRKMPELKLDTAAVPERTRQPYHIPLSAPAKPGLRRQSVSQSKEPPADHHRPVRAKPFVHQPGACWVCDQYGKHIDIKQEMSRASTVAPPQPSSKTSRQVAPRSAKDDDALPDRTRRVSTSRQPRPLSMMPQAFPQQYMSYGPPVVATSGWGTPVTPSVPYNSVPYSYPPPSPMPGTSFASFPQMLPFMDSAPPSEPQSARPSRRSSPVRRPSTYGDPVVRHTYAEAGTNGLEKVPSRESRPVLSSRRSGRVMDDDRISMPPPPPPQPKTQPAEIVLVRRPSARRSKTYHPTEAPLRERYYESDDEYDAPDSRAPLSPMRSRRESHSPSRPPTSYRGPSSVETRDRPALPRKSVSYSTGTTTTKIASSKVATAPRRTTMPSSVIPLEQKELEAEHYQHRRSKTSSELTAEALRDLNKRNSGSKSETGSSYSHKSHQSSSKDSSGRGRSHTSGTRTSITLPGGLNIGIPNDYMDKDGRPLSISVGGLVLSVGTEGKEVARVKEQKRIERAPSVASRASRKSMSSNMSSRDPVQSSRRLSHVEDGVTNLRSSGQVSRAPSVNGRNQEYRRQSVDYGKPVETAFYGA